MVGGSFFCDDSTELGLDSVGFLFTDGPDRNLGEVGLRNCTCFDLFPLSDSGFGVARQPLPLHLVNLFKLCYCRRVIVGKLLVLCHCFIERIYSRGIRIQKANVSRE